MFSRKGEIVIEVLILIFAEKWEILNFGRKISQYLAPKVLNPWPLLHLSLKAVWSTGYTHRTTGCFDDRLLIMMTDTGFYMPWSRRVGYNFRLAKLLERSSVTLWLVSTLVCVERPYRNKLTLYPPQIKPHLVIISEVSREKSQKTVICSGCGSLRQSLLSAFIYNKTTIIQLHFC